MASGKQVIKDSEERIPELAKSATRSAYRRAIVSGSVLISKNGEIRRVEPDGTSSVVKKLPPRVKMQKGAIIAQMSTIL